MVMRDYHSVDYWDVTDLAGHLRVTFGTQPRQWGAAILEHRVEQDSQTAWELNIITCVP